MFRKIDDAGWKSQACKSPLHNPPGSIALPPGHYVWTCPACGYETRVYVSAAECLSASTYGSKAQAREVKKMLYRALYRGDPEERK